MVSRTQRHAVAGAEGESLVAVLDGPVGVALEEAVVLAAAVQADGCPHPVVVGEQIDLGWPHDVEDRQLSRAVPGGEGRDLPHVAYRTFDGGRATRRPLDLLLDGEGGACPSASASVHLATKSSTANTTASYGSTTAPLRRRRLRTRPGWRRRRTQARVRRWWSDRCSRPWCRRRDIVERTAAEHRGCLHGRTPCHRLVVVRDDHAPAGEVGNDLAVRGTAGRAADQHDPPLLGARRPPRAQTWSAPARRLHTTPSTAARASCSGPHVGADAGEQPGGARTVGRPFAVEVRHEHQPPSAGGNSGERQVVERGPIDAEEASHGVRDLRRRPGCRPTAGTGRWRPRTNPATAPVSSAAGVRLTVNAVPLVPKLRARSPGRSPSRARPPDVVPRAGPDDCARRVLSRRPSRWVRARPGSTASHGIAASTRARRSGRYRSSAGDHQPVVPTRLLVIRRRTARQLTGQPVVREHDLGKTSEDVGFGASEATAAS